MIGLALFMLVAAAPQTDTAAPPPLPVSAPLLAPAGPETFRVGEPLLALRLPDVSGSTTIDLRDFRGRRLVLFEFASW